jgi:hypothetical protein
VVEFGRRNTQLFCLSLVKSGNGVAAALEVPSGAAQTKRRALQREQPDQLTPQHCHPKFCRRAKKWPKTESSV